MQLKHEANLFISDAAAPVEYTVRLWISVASAPNVRPNQVLVAGRTLTAVQERIKELIADVVKDQENSTKRNGRYQ